MLITYAFAIHSALWLITYFDTKKQIIECLFFRIYFVTNKEFIYNNFVCANQNLSDIH